MPRYFFHTGLGEDVIPDHEGTELRDPDHAWEVARDTALAALADAGSRTQLVRARLVVTDEAGEVVLEFPFAEALTARKH